MCCNDAIINRTNHVHKSRRIIKTIVVAIVGGTKEAIMVRPGREELSGVVEVDETYVCGQKPGKRGRGAEGKTLVMIAVEDKNELGFGRIRLGRVEDASGYSLTKFIEDKKLGFPSRHYCG